ncbi:hypothetical protein TNCV_4318291 [Trichonephila clavipes]|nr:hypothetical protein TNCV_4318291 [Trichonephila clavipes]
MGSRGKFCREMRPIFIWMRLLTHKIAEFGPLNSFTQCKKHLCIHQNSLCDVASQPNSSLGHSSLRLSLRQSQRNVYRQCTNIPQQAGSFFDVPQLEQRKCLNQIIVKQSKVSSHIDAKQQLLRQHFTDERVIIHGFAVA